MRVLILHDDIEEAQSIRSAAYQCWGNPPLVQVDVVHNGGELLAKLARRSGWPDTDPVRPRPSITTQFIRDWASGTGSVLGKVIAVWRILEREPSLITGLGQHPARGFFRTLVIVQSSDEYGRAVLWQASGDIVMAPVTAERLVNAMTAFESVS